jgi:hypothetical protein
VLDFLELLCSLIDPCEQNCKKQADNHEDESKEKRCSDIPIRSFLCFTVVFSDGSGDDSIEGAAHFGERDTNTESQLRNNKKGTDN